MFSHGLDKAKSSAREDGAEGGRLAGGYWKLPETSDNYGLPLQDIDHRLQRHDARLYGHARGTKWAISRRVINRWVRG